MVLFDREGTAVTGVSFGASPSSEPFATFDNAAGLGTGSAPFPTVARLSIAGTNGAFVAVDGHGVGSPGVTPAPVLPTVSIGSASVVEGDTGTTKLVLAVTLSEPSTSTVTVEWATTSGEQPEAGVDYEAASGTVTFLPGETSAFVTVTVFGDTEVEPGQAWRAEWLAVVLANPTNARLAAGWDHVGFGLIIDDD